jgi:excisionase family DNA binding protein
MERIMEGFEQWTRAHRVDPLNSPKRTCELLGCGHDFFYGLVKAKKLKIYKLGAKSVVKAEDIYRLISELPLADRAA